VAFPTFLQLKIRGWTGDEAWRVFSLEQRGFGASLARDIARLEADEQSGFGGEAGDLAIEARERAAQGVAYRLVEQAIEAAGAHAEAVAGGAGGTVPRPARVRARGAA
jgi:hypothetical protein